MNRGWGPRSFGQDPSGQNSLCSIMFGRKGVTRYYGGVIKFVVARYIKQTQTVPGRLPQPSGLKYA